MRVYCVADGIYNNPDTTSQVRVREITVDDGMVVTQGHERIGWLTVEQADVDRWKATTDTGYLANLILTDEDKIAWEGKANAS